MISTFAFGLICNILSFATSTFCLPTVCVVAIICLFKLEMLISSLSTNIKFPIPVLTKASTTKEPTPPIPNTATFAFCNFFTASFPINNSVLVLTFSIFLS